MRTEDEKWQILMNSCRRACKILNIDFNEPMYLDWESGRKYYQILWGQVRIKKNKNRMEKNYNLNFMSIKSD